MPVVSPTALLVTQLLQDGVPTDFDVVVNGCRVPAHGLILRWRIPYFAGLFSVGAGSVEASRGQVEISLPGPVAARHVRAVLAYSYGGDISVDGLPDVQPLLSLARYLLMDELCDAIRVESLTFLRTATSADLLCSGITDDRILDQAGELLLDGEFHITDRSHEVSLIRAAYENNAEGLLRALLGGLTAEAALAVFLYSQSVKRESEAGCSFDPAHGLIEAASLSVVHRDFSAYLSACAGAPDPAAAAAAAAAGAADGADVVRGLSSAPLPDLCAIFLSDNLDPRTHGEQEVAALVARVLSEKSRDRQPPPPPPAPPLLALAALGPGRPEACADREAAPPPPESGGFVAFPRGKERRGGSDGGPGDASARGGEEAPGWPAERLLESVVRSPLRSSSGGSREAGDGWCEEEDGSGFDGGPGEAFSAGGALGRARGREEATDRPAERLLESVVCSLPRGCDGGSREAAAGWCEEEEGGGFDAALARRLADDARRRASGLRCDRAALHDCIDHLLVAAAAVAGAVFAAKTRLFVRLAPVGVRSEWELIQIRYVTEAGEQPLDEAFLRVSDCYASAGERRFDKRNLLTPRETETWSAPRNSKSSSWAQYAVPYPAQPVSSALLLLTLPPAATHGSCRPFAVSISTSRDGVSFSKAMPNVRVHPTRTLVVDLTDVLREPPPQSES
ncbi:hypothetical protein DIPPA_28045 [Diplonema papillatum]|nr:hypothetical protein DIPPA_28045 [Diplonema papillatum]